MQSDTKASVAEVNSGSCSLERPVRKFYVELFAPNQKEWVRPGGWDETLEAAIEWSKNQPECVRDWKKRVVLVETTATLIPEERSHSDAPCWKCGSSLDSKFHCGNPECVLYFPNVSDEVSRTAGGRGAKEEKL